MKPIAKAPHRSTRDGLEPAGPEPRVYVVLCVYEPDRDLFAGQIRSILNQDHANLEIVIVPDGPTPEAEEVLKSFSDRRIHYLAQADRVGVYANFGRALRHAVSRSRSASDLFAYSDQDDIWRPDKLSRHVSYLHNHPAVSLTHSDARVVDAAGNTIHESMFAYERRNKVSSVANLLLVNNVTGMTAVFRKTVATIAADAPPQKGLFFHHDLWTALIAASIGEIGVIDAPLVDYAQHNRNVIGAVEVAPGPRERKRGFMTRVYIRMCIDQYILRYYLFRRLKAALGDRVGKQSAGVSLLAEYLYGTGFFGCEALPYAMYLACTGKRGLARQAFRLGIGKLALLAQVMRIKNGGSIVYRFRARTNAECKTLLDYTANLDAVQIMASQTCY